MIPVLTKLLEIISQLVFFHKNNYSYYFVIREIMPSYYFVVSEIIHSYYFIISEKMHNINKSLDTVKIQLFWTNKHYEL